MLGIFREENEGKSHLCSKFVSVFNQSGKYHNNHCLFNTVCAPEKLLASTSFLSVASHILLQPGLTSSQVSPPPPRMRVVVCLRGGGWGGHASGAGAIARPSPLPCVLLEVGELAEGLLAVGAVVGLGP